MTFKYIVEGVVGALICGFICGCWYLLGEWIMNISFRRWKKKMDEQSEQKEESK